MTWAPFLVHFVAGQGIVWILGLMLLSRQDIVQACHPLLAKMALRPFCGLLNPPMEGPNCFRGFEPKPF